VECVERRVRVLFIRCPLMPFERSAIAGGAPLDARRSACGARCVDIFHAYAHAVADYAQQ